MSSAAQALTTSRAVARALLDLALPSTCAACEGPVGPVCDSCWGELRRGLFPRPARSWPDPVPVHLPPLVARGPYAGVLPALVTAYKDEGRRDLRDVLSPLLAESLVVVSRMRPVVVVPVPSSRAAVRHRGDDPVRDLIRAACDQLACGAQVVPALRPVRRLADQSALGRRDRALNLGGAYTVANKHRRAVAGRVVVLADDVVTTGATLAEAARAVREAGGLVVGAATVAATQLRARTGPAAPTPSRDHGSAARSKALRS